MQDDEDGWPAVQRVCVGGLLSILTKTNTILHPHILYTIPCTRTASCISDLGGSSHVQQLGGLGMSMSSCICSILVPPEVPNRPGRITTGYNSPTPCTRSRTTVASHPTQNSGSPFVSESTSNGPLQRLALILLLIFQASCWFFLANPRAAEKSERSWSSNILSNIMLQCDALF